MEIYAVRLQRNQEAVGVYVAFDPVHLACMIDETTDAVACEYAEIDCGGVVWDNPGSWKMKPFPEGAGDDDLDIDLSGATLTEGWSGQLLFDDLEWTPIDDFTALAGLVGVERAKNVMTGKVADEAVATIETLLNIDVEKMNRTDH